MLANRLAKYAALRGIYYGWVMAALAFFYVLFSSSALGITAVLIKPLRANIFRFSSNNRHSRNR